MRKVARTFIFDLFGLPFDLWPSSYILQIKDLIQDSAGEGFIILATVRHRVDPSNVFLKVLRYWQNLYICKQVCFVFVQIKEL